MKPIRIINLISFLIVVTVNALANTLPINGLTTGEISDGINALFTPAGYVFSIWGVIYLALTGFVVFQLLKPQQDNARLKKLGPWFIISNLLNSAWIFAWHYEQFLISFILMLGILGSLLLVYLKLEIGLAKPKTWQERLFIDLPFSIYLGWISVATIANTSVVLIKSNWNNFGIDPAIWTAIMIAIAGVLGILMIYRRKEIAYPLVLIWAIIGITQNVLSTALIDTTAWITVGVLAAVLIVKQFLNKPKSI